MIQGEERTYTAADGTELPLCVWWAGQPRAAVVYLHGIQSHSGWYAASSRAMAEAGIAVYQIDRRGSGRDKDVIGLLPISPCSRLPRARHAHRTAP